MSSHHSTARSLAAASIPAYLLPPLLLNSFFSMGFLSRACCPFFLSWPPPTHPTRPLTGRRGRPNGHTAAQPIHLYTLQSIKVTFMQSDGRKGRDTYLRGCTQCFGSLDADEWIYLLLANLHRPGGPCSQAADDGWDALVACAHVSLHMACAVNGIHSSMLNCCRTPA